MFLCKTSARSTLDLSAQASLLENRKDVDPKQVDQIDFLLVGFLGLLGLPQSSSRF